MTRQTRSNQQQFKDVEVNFSIQLRPFSDEQIAAGNRLFKRLIERVMNNDSVDGKVLSLENEVGCNPGGALAEHPEADGMNKEHGAKRNA